MNTRLINVVLIMLLLISCRGNDFGEVPVLETLPVTNITDTTAVSGGTISDDGGRNITAKGICWDTSMNPVTTDNVNYEGTGGADFTSTMTFLRPGITYYVRAYATTASGTGYGNNVSFTAGAK